MAESIEHGFWNLHNVFPRAVSRVVLQDANDLVVCFILIEHAQTANGSAFRNHIAVANGAVGENAYFTESNGNHLRMVKRL